MDDDKHKEYIDYRAQCHMEGRTPLDYQSWLDLMARFCYQPGDLQLEQNDEE